MDNIEILKSQIKELTKLIEIKDSIIKELEKRPVSVPYYIQPYQYYPYYSYPFICGSATTQQGQNIQSNTSLQVLSGNQK